MLAALARARGRPARRLRLLRLLLEQRHRIEDADGDPLGRHGRGQQRELRARLGLDRQRRLAVHARPRTREGKGGRGQISEGGLSFNLILLDGTAYISGSPAFYSHFGGPAAAQLLEGKWLKAPASSGTFSSLGSLTDLDQLLSTALSDHGALAKGPTTTIDGQQVLSVTDASHGGTLYVATTGKPYPIEISKSGKTGGKISFGSWNAPVTLAAPKDAIDLSQLESHG